MLSLSESIFAAVGPAAEGRNAPQAGCRCTQVLLPAPEWYHPQEAAQRHTHVAAGSQCQCQLLTSLTHNMNSKSRLVLLGVLVVVCSRSIDEAVGCKHTSQCVTTRHRF